MAAPDAPSSEDPDAARLRAEAAVLVALNVSHQTTNDVGAEEPEFELGKKDLLFRQCLRSRLDRAARLRKEAQEKKATDERKRKEALNAAFENETETLLEFLSSGGEVDSADLYGCTLLSEAAAGGAEDCVEVLLGHGANPNALGRNKRTPVWRACNAGYVCTVQSLLRGGADPRTPDDAGVMPFNVANGSTVRMLLECWDTSVTDTMQKSLSVSQERADKERRQKEKKQTTEMQDALDEGERRAQVAKCEVTRMQRLVFEYRHQQVRLAERGELVKMEEMVRLLQNAEHKLEDASNIRRDLDWQVKRSRMKLRDLEYKVLRKNKQPGEVLVKPDQIILLRDLADVVTLDVGGKRREDGRWPLVFDPSGHSMTFFRYSGAACFDVAELYLLSVSEKLEERQRLLLALLRHMKHGGQVVVNLGEDFSQMSTVEAIFNDIDAEFFRTFVDRSVLYSYLLPRRFMHLVPSSYTDDYCVYMFDDELLAKFVFVFVVTGLEPSPDVMEKECHAFHIVKVRDLELEKELAIDVED